VQKGKLNNGTSFLCPGISSDKYKGWRSIPIPAMRIPDLYYGVPDLKMGFIVFSNLGDVNVYEQAYKMADLLSRCLGKAPARDIIVDSSKS